MNYKILLQQSRDYMNAHPVYVSRPLSAHIFSSGAKWMYQRMNEPAAVEKKFDPATSFGWYGWLKYGICCSAFFAALVLFSMVNIFLTPLAVLVFYFFEVQFLFLFPLLIDNNPQPIRASIRATYQTGIFTCMKTVIPISIFMLAGLLNLKQPFKNWHIGSMAIIIWYKNDIRNRL
jgi:hypothetical protein